MRAAAQVAQGYKSPRVKAMVVPGSQAVKRLAEAEKLDEIFRSAGFEWRESGCSMCLGMNPDTLQPGSDALPRATGISKAGKARADVPTW